MIIGAFVYKCFRLDLAYIWPKQKHKHEFFVRSFLTSTFNYGFFCFHPAIASIARAQRHGPISLDAVNYFPTFQTNRLFIDVKGEGMSRVY